MRFIARAHTARTLTRLTNTNVREIGRRRLTGEAHVYVHTSIYIWHYTIIVDCRKQERCRSLVSSNVVKISNSFEKKPYVAR